MCTKYMYVLVGEDIVIGIVLVALSLEIYGLDGESVSEKNRANI